MVAYTHDLGLNYLFYSDRIYCKFSTRTFYLCIVLEISNFMKKILHSWKKLTTILGNFLNTIILLFFYYVFLPLFAVSYRLFGKNILKSSSSHSNWIDRFYSPNKLADFKGE